ncbi:MAG TPA: hydrolase [Isosphaeraceae bacterium]|jgi:nicotinamidase-related amidase|nr:hydrolase [Isosphaeraceae bacterium]
MSPTERRTAAGGALLVVDMQEKLLAAIDRRELVVANTLRLVRAADALGMPAWATEQYPKGLGPTTAPLAERFPDRPDKTKFHCCAIPQVLEQLHGRSIRHVTLAGIEAHVCVAQTALELLRLGFGVEVPADAVASRGAIDWEFALRRLERAGAIVTTTEAVLFEWIEGSDHPQFKAISALVKGVVPPRPAPEDHHRADSRSHR